MPRIKKPTPTFSHVHHFAGGETIKQSIGESIVRQIEEAARLLALATSMGDAESIKAAQAMRAKLVDRIDALAGDVGMKSVNGAKAAEAKTRLRANGELDEKQARAAKEIQALLDAKKEPHNIPSILAKAGTCSERHARETLKKMGF